MGKRTIAEVVAGGRLKRFMDRRLIKALGHPLREHILVVLNERIASAKEIGEEIGLEVEDFYHHFEVLEAIGYIERVETKRRRGAREHFFRAKACLHLDDSQWERIPPTLQSDLSTCAVQPIFDDVVAAMRAQTFDARSDRHAIWLSGYLDEQGLREKVDLLNATLANATAIQERSARRLAEKGERGIPWTTAVLGFEVPDSLGPSRDLA